MTRDTCPRLMPSTWYRPNSFLRRFMMKLLAYTMRKPMTTARNIVRPPMMLPSSSGSPSSCKTISAWTEMVLNE